MTAAFDVIGPRTGNVLIIADHASNHMPSVLDNLGLEPRWLNHHIALDIGTGPLARALSAGLGLRAVLAGFSRLLIDANRPENHPDLIPEASDGVSIPGNCGLDMAGRQYRLDQFHRPYHAAIAAEAAAIEARGETPIFLSLHSFTPVMDGFARPWHCGLLWNRDNRLAAQAADWLDGRGNLVVGRNQPYSGKILNHTMDNHAEARGHPYITLEIRQDLIADEAGVGHWREIVATLLLGLGLISCRSTMAVSKNITHL